MKTRIEKSIPSETAKSSAGPNDDNQKPIASDSPGEAPGINAKDGYSVPAELRGFGCAPAERRAAAQARRRHPLGLGVTQLAGPRAHVGPRVVGHTADGVAHGR